LGFKEGREWFGTDGCNRFLGSYAAKGPRVTLTVGLSTRAGCGTESRARYAALVKRAWEGGTSLHGGSLVLRNGGVVLTMTAATPNSPK
jgi:heat shock protein HslJ